MTCVQCENGKSISLIGSSQPSIAHGACDRAKSDLDLAGPSGDNHQAARHASPCRLTQSSVSRRDANHIVGPQFLWRTRIRVNLLRVRLAEPPWAVGWSCLDDLGIKEVRAARGQSLTS